MSASPVELRSIDVVPAAVSPSSAPARERNCCNKYFITHWSQGFLYVFGIAKVAVGVAALISNNLTAAIPLFIMVPGDALAIGAISYFYTARTIEKSANQISGEMRSLQEKTIALEGERKQWEADRQMWHGKDEEHAAELRKNTDTIQELNGKVTALTSQLKAAEGSFSRLNTIGNEVIKATIEGKTHIDKQQDEQTEIDKGFNRILEKLAGENSKAQNAERQIEEERVELELLVKRAQEQWRIIEASGQGETKLLANVTAQHQSLSAQHEKITVSIKENQELVRQLSHDKQEVQQLISTRDRQMEKLNAKLAKMEVIVEVSRELHDIQEAAARKLDDLQSSISQTNCTCLEKGRIATLCSTVKSNFSGLQERVKTSITKLEALFSKKINWHT